MNLEGMHQGEPANSEQNPEASFYGELQKELGLVEQEILKSKISLEKNEKLSTHSVICYNIEYNGKDVGELYLPTNDTKWMFIGARNGTENMFQNGISSNISTSLLNIDTVEKYFTNLRRKIDIVAPAQLYHGESDLFPRERGLKEGSYTPGVSIGFSFDNGTPGGSGFPKGHINWDGRNRENRNTSQKHKVAQEMLTSSSGAKKGILVITGGKPILTHTSEVDNKQLTKRIDDKADIISLPSAKRGKGNYLDSAVNEKSVGRYFVELRDPNHVDKSDVVKNVGSERVALLVLHNSSLNLSSKKQIMEEIYSIGGREYAIGRALSTDVIANHQDGVFLGKDGLKYKPDNSKSKEGADSSKGPVGGGLILYTP